ncbi:hypothetical protein ACIQ7D_13455 [Streptomyces sp. NPDC096310]|uniref:hypothetical protein n=1 Tax=Streptomyces sp. NPDC096310 TaxID=3366082 RepID=UPI0037F5C775
MSPRRIRPHLHTALAAWERARTVAESADPLRTGLTYHRAVQHLQWYVSLLRTARDPAFGDEVSAACHALSFLGREALPKVRAARATRQVVVHARITLAAAHLADPAHGDPHRVPEVWDGPVLDRLAPDGVGDVTVAERVRAAADVRLLVAELFAGHPQVAVPTGGRWAVTGTVRTGIGAPYRDRHDFQRAVLPSCAQLDASGEAVQLGYESVRLHAALARELPGHTGEYDRAKRALESLAARVGVTAPTVR